MKKLGTLVAVCAAIASVRAQNLIPQPVSVVRSEGAITLSLPLLVEVRQMELAPLALYLEEYLPGGRVTLAIDAAMSLPAQGYRLEVKPEGISVRGMDYPGVWNGIQTLLQLFPAEFYDKKLRGQAPTLPLITIEDWPRMAYRGVMLDVARTFVPPERVMKLIDDLAHHKINRLHLHLTDDEGWRIEILSHPELTAVGAFRGGEEPLRAIYGEWDSRYGGYYTQDDIRRMVAWAAVRGVEIIPEIDLPGHSRAAARANPSILCPYTPNLRASAGVDTRGVWCVAREENYRLLDDVIGEVAALFPSEVIHLGGDEVSPHQWSHCPDCKALAASRKLSPTAFLEDVFMERAIAIAARHGKRAAVWNEAARSGTLAHSTLVYSWEKPAAVRGSASQGYPTVACPGSYLYFDMAQYAGDAGHRWAGVVPLRRVYSFGEWLAALPESEKGSVTGVEATFFSELLLAQGPEFLDRQLFPRVCALAEVGWTPPEKCSWSDFERRMTTPTAEAPSHTERLAAMGIDYRTPPVADKAPAAPLKTPTVRFTSSMPENPRHPFSGVASYRRAARTRRTAVEGDWLQWRFVKPVSCTTIEVLTGYDYLQRAGLPRGRVEVSYDGRTFLPAATLHDLGAHIEVDPVRPVRALRVVCDAHGNGESYVIIQPLRIR